MIILSIATLIEAVMTQIQSSRSKETILSKAVLSQVTITLYQLSSVFEAGVSVACVVTLHNWFNEKILGIVSSIWFAAFNA